MKSDFATAISQLCSEKGVSRDAVMHAISQPLSPRLVSRSTLCLQNGSCGMTLCFVCFSGWSFSK